jgi:hypothetical protein
MLACASFTEESVEGIITPADCLVAWHLAIRLDAMLKAKELPARVANLDATLADVEAKSFTHGCEVSAESRS